MTPYIIRMCFTLFTFVSLSHLFAESELRTLKQFCMNRGDCFHLIGLGTQVEGKFLIDPVSWDEAFTKCRSLGGRLAVVNNGELQWEIVRYFTNVDDDAFKTEGSKHAWIAGRKDDNWRWIDGREYNESQLRFTRDTQRCAFATHNAGVQTFPCESEVFNYICTFKDKDCPGDTTREGWHGPTCSGTYNEGGNWLSAREACLSKGGDMFTLLPEYDGFSWHYIIDTDEEAWIGLQRGLWQWVVPSDGSQDTETKPMQYWNWAEGESSHSVGEQCLSMDLQARAKWRDKACRFSKYFICENILPHTSTTTTTTTPTPTKSSTIPTRSPSVSWPRPTASQTTHRSATVLPTAPTTKPAILSTTSNEMLYNGTRDTLSSTAAPPLSPDIIVIIAVAIAVAIILAVVITVLVIRLRSGKAAKTSANGTPVSPANAYANVSFDHAGMTDENPADDVKPDLLYANTLPTGDSTYAEVDDNRKNAKKQSRWKKPAKAPSEVSAAPAVEPRGHRSGDGQSTSGNGSVRHTMAPNSLELYAVSDKKK